MKEEIFYSGCVCPVCESGKMGLVRKDLKFEYKGNTLELERDVWECSECHESFLQAHDEPEIDVLLTDRRRRVDGLLVSEEIVRIREQLRLTQAELAQSLRIPEQSLVMYETGEDVQSYALDDLLRLLRVYPDAVNALRREWQRIGFQRQMTPQLAGA